MVPFLNCLSRILVMSATALSTASISISAAISAFCIKSLYLAFSTCAASSARFLQRASAKSAASDKLFLYSPIAGIACFRIAAPIAVTATNSPVGLWLKAETSGPMAVLIILKIFCDKFVKLAAS